MDPAALKRFLDHCRETDTPVDFITWHRYTDSLAELENNPRAAWITAVNCGFADAELHLNEWHYIPDLPDKSKKYNQTAPDGWHGIDSAAFITSILSLWQDTPLTMSNYYRFQSLSYGLYDPYGDKHTTFYAFQLFAAFADHLQRVEAESSQKDTVILAAKNSDGSGIILVSIFKMQTDTVEIKLQGLEEDAEISVSIVEDETGIREYVPALTDNNMIRLEKNGDSAIFLIKIKGVQR